MSDGQGEDVGRTTGQWVGLVILGLVAGFLSGMFGVGGGILIVPGLVALAHFSPKLASGTSLAAIVPLALVGVSSYAFHGSVAWVAAALLALGAIAGAKIGTTLLEKIRPERLQLVFSFFMVFVIVTMFLVVPDREAEWVVTWLDGVGLLVAGVATGTLSGLLGVGGGVIVVPVLMLFFGASDLVAKGTSLLVMIPSALMGTTFNVRNHNVDLGAALAVGLGACVTTYLGSMAAVAVSPQVANILFAAFLAVVAARMFIKAVKGIRAEKK